MTLPALNSEYIALSVSFFLLSLTSSGVFVFQQAVPWGGRWRKLFLQVDNIFGQVAQAGRCWGWGAQPAKAAGCKGALCPPCPFAVGTELSARIQSHFCPGETDVKQLSS